jgi:hypothetical protein
MCAIAAANYFLLHMSYIYIFFLVNDDHHVFYFASIYAMELYQSGKSSSPLFIHFMV